MSTLITVMEWLAQYALVAVVTVVFAFFGLAVIASIRARKAAVNIRRGAMLTFATMLVGIAMSVAIGVIIWKLVMYITGLIIPQPDPILVLGRHLIGIFLGALIGYQNVFVPGRRSKPFHPANPMIEIKPGERAFLKLWGIPFGNLGPGWPWILPWGMEYKIVPIAAHQDVSGENAMRKEEYLTANGVEIFVTSGVTYMIDDPLAAQGIGSEADIRAYISAQRRAAIKNLVAQPQYTIPIDLAFEENPTREEQVKLFEELIRIKAGIFKNGPGDVFGEMNMQIGQYGMRVMQVQFEEVLFSDQLEVNIRRTFDEIAQAPGLQKDMLNKAAQIKTFMDATLAHVGIDMADLTLEQKLNLVTKNQAYVLSAEGQGGYHYYDFGSAPPPGVIVTTPPNQPPRNGDEK